MTRRAVLGFAVLLVLGAILLTRPPGKSATHSPVPASQLPTPWPPAMGETYPDLELVDQHGREFTLASLQGKVLIVEPIGMNCPACQGFSGGNEVGGLGGFQPQRGALALEKYIEGYAPTVSLTHPDLVLVQLLLYDLSMGPPGPEDAKTWARHFPSAFANRLVVVPQKSLISQASYDLIPGFQLVDREFILRSDSAGHQPRHSLTDHLFPRLETALGG